jgi:hypothetical protein
MNIIGLVLLFVLGFVVLCGLMYLMMVFVFGAAESMVREMYDKPNLTTRELFTFSYMDED